jgi:hypothetical protein
MTSEFSLPAETRCLEWFGHGGSSVVVFMMFLLFILFASIVSLWGKTPPNPGAASRNLQLRPFFVASQSAARSKPFLRRLFQVHQKQIRVRQQRRHQEHIEIFAVQTALRCKLVEELGVAVVL